MYFEINVNDCLSQCLRPGFHTKLPPVGLTSVMTYFHDNEYEFTFLDIDINEYGYNHNKKNKADEDHIMVIECE